MFSKALYISACISAFFTILSSLVKLKLWVNTTISRASCSPPISLEYNVTSTSLPFDLFGLIYGVHINVIFFDSSINFSYNKPLSISSVLYKLFSFTNSSICFCNSSLFASISLYLFCKSFKDCLVSSICFSASSFA